MDENERYENICKPAFERIEENQSANAKRMEEKQDKILEILQGNGKDGLITKIDRLEQKEIAREKAEKPKDALSLTEILTAILRNKVAALLVITILGTPLAGVILRGSGMSQEQQKALIDSLVDQAKTQFAQELKTDLQGQK